MKIDSVNHDVFSMPLRTEDEIIRRCRKVRGLYWLLLIALMAALPWMPAGQTTGWTTVLLRVMAFTVGLYVTKGIFELVPALRAHQYDWLSRSKCDSLADLCDENPGLVPYRDRVRAEGRRFTRGEYDNMRKWVGQQDVARLKAEHAARERAACQRLYGVSAE